MADDNGIPLCDGGITGEVLMPESPGLSTLNGRRRSLRMAIVGHFGPSEPVLAGVDLWGRLHTIGAVGLEYFRLLLWPNVLQLDFYYQEVIGIQTGGSMRSWMGLTTL